MQQRQLRLGDILDDYCPRERRVTNHAVVAMIGEEVKKTRCTTCDTEHEYKHAKVPRQRRKNEAPAALYAQVAAGAPKRVTSGEPVKPHEAVKEEDDESHGQDSLESPESPGHPGNPEERVEPGESEAPGDDVQPQDVPEHDDGPVHRPLIRASLPRPEGHQPPARPIPEFTIRQPGTGARPHRFRPRHRGGPRHQGHQFDGSQGGNTTRGPRPHSGRPGPKRHGHGGGRKRSK
jgi:hypothetical protein